MRIVNVYILIIYFNYEVIKMSRQYRVFNRKMFSLMVEVSSKKELKEKKRVI